jgi:fructose-1,6-bisphosphatase class II|tara:strand:+ start:679 stop:1623 length:945 start_codon:yes stop_codon:yes gene_type:complete
MSKVTENYHIYLKATELAAIAAAKLRGNGDGKAADKVATEAMREVLQESNIHTRVVIGEGERDDAPMLYIGEEMGDLSSDLKIDIAVDPLECTNHCAKNLPDALAVLAAAPRGALLHAPDTYMDKLCGSKELIGKLSLSNSVSENLKATSKALNKNISDLKIIVMDRDRHIDLIREMNLLGVEPILIGDGDVSGGLKATEGSVDLLYGIGAAPEGVITATAVKAMGGYFEGKLHFIDQSFKDRATTMLGEKIYNTWSDKELCKSSDSFFVASGVCTGWIPGVEFNDDKAIVTSKIIFGDTKETKIITNEYLLGE